MPLTPRPPSARGGTSKRTASTSDLSPVRVSRPGSSGGASQKRPEAFQPGQCNCLVELVARQKAFCLASSVAARMRISEELRSKLHKRNDKPSCIDSVESPCRNESLYLLGLMQLQLIMIDKALQTLLEVNLRAALDRALRFRVTLTLAVCFGVLERRTEAEQLLTAAGALAPSEGESWMVEENRRVVDQYLNSDVGFHRTPMEERLGQFYFYSLDPLPEAEESSTANEDPIPPVMQPQQPPPETPIRRAELPAERPLTPVAKPSGSTSEYVPNSDRLTFLQEVAVPGCDSFTFKRYASGRITVEASFVHLDRGVQQLTQISSGDATLARGSKVVVMDSVCEMPCSGLTSSSAEDISFPLDPPLAEFTPHAKRVRAYWNSQSVASLLKALETGGAPTFAPGECLEKSDLVEHCVKYLPTPAPPSRQPSSPLPRYTARFSISTDSEWAPVTLRGLISKTVLALRQGRLESAHTTLQAVMDAVQLLLAFTSDGMRNGAGLNSCSLFIDQIVCLLHEESTKKAAVAKVLLLPIRPQGTKGIDPKTAEESILGLLSEIRRALTIAEPPSLGLQPVHDAKPMTVFSQELPTATLGSGRLLTSFLRQIDQWSFLLRHFKINFLLQSKLLGCAGLPSQYNDTPPPFELLEEFCNALRETSTTLNLTLSRANLVKEMVYLLTNLAPRELLRPFNVKLHQETAIDGGRGGVLNDVIETFLQSVCSVLVRRPAQVSPEMGRSVGNLLFKCLVEHRGAFLHGLSPFQIRFIFEPATQLLTRNPAEFLATSPELTQHGVVSKATMEYLEEQWFRSVTDGELWEAIYHKDPELFRSLALVAQCDNPTQLEQLDLWWNVDLQGAKSTKVTMENKPRFIRAQLLEHLLPLPTRRGLRYIRDGFCLVALQVLPKRLRSLVFREYQNITASLGLSADPQGEGDQEGDAALPAASIVKCLEFHGWTPNDATPYFLCVWLHEAPLRKRRQFLRLCTGSSTLPECYTTSSSSSSSTTGKIRVYRSELNFSTRTCFWQLNLPPFSSIEQLREAMGVAVHALELDPTMAETVPQ